MSLDDFSVYSLHGSDIHSFLKPASVSCTIAVTSKYDPPSSENISALGLCLHTDMRAVTLSCSKPQVGFYILVWYWMCLCLGIFINFIVGSMQLRQVDEIIEA